ncbi:MAG TPA: TaqI-like C-terminal specificity domain-containing protein, partial [Polyangiaceae bacterium]|nr:TaqI-like C-terminal specificity domain-containing protein [Polyangiaceae bacterium]
VEFVAHPPTLFASKDHLGGRLRSAAQWQQVRLLIRQTARFPIAAPADGTPFRNSVLAGFSSAQFSEFFLLCYLNSDVIRWYHFMSKRDARQGMPQLKIGHLRHLPAPAHSAAIADLDALGKALVEQGRAPDKAERTRLNKLASAALRLSADEQRLVSRWAQENPPPKSRQFRTPS